MYMFITGIIVLGQKKKKNICLYKLSRQNKIGLVGRKIFLFIFWGVIEGPKGFLVLKLTLNTLPFVQTLAKLVCKYNWT